MNNGSSKSYLKPLLWKNAFTLVEMLVAVGIGTAAIGMATLTSVDLYKDFASANAYRGIHKSARDALAHLSRDIRSGIQVNSTSTTNLSMSVIGLTGSTNTISWYLINNTSNPTIKNLVRSETIAGTTTLSTMTDSATAVKFEYWANPGNPAVTANDAFEVRATLMITNTTLFRVSTDLLQTRVLMRNKHY